MKGLYWVYVYAIELWKMILIMRGILGIEPVRKRQVLMFQIPAVLGVLVSFKYQLPVNIVIVLFIMLSAWIYFNKFFLSVFTWLGISIMDFLIGLFIIFFAQMDFQTAYNSNHFADVEEVFSFLLLIVIIALRKRFEVRKIQYTYSDVALGAMVLVGVIACTGPFLSEGFENWTSIGKRLEILLGFLLMLFGISSIIYRICRVRQEQEQFEQQMLWNERLLNEQKKYYELLLQKEETTKKIRHYMKSQLACLSRFLEKEEYGSARDYLRELTGNIKRLNILISTGNDVVDIVVNDIIQSEKIELSWKGKIPSRLNMTNAEICILFSNLLKNAAEAVRDMDDKTVDVTVKLNGHHLVLEESNRTMKPVIIEDGRLKTTKHDKEKHGIGSRNMIEIAEKYNGDVSFRFENGRFHVKIILLDTI